MRADKEVGMPAVRKLVVVLAAASVAGLVPTAASGSPSAIQTASYPWVTPPVWTGVLPASQAEWPAQTTSYAPTQPPATVPISPVPAFTASTGYVWVQPGTAPATAYPTTQPPASIPTAGAP
jgi:hypothetical protein